MHLLICLSIVNNGVSSTHCLPPLIQPDPRQQKKHLKPFSRANLSFARSVDAMPWYDLRQCCLSVLFVSVIVDLLFRPITDFLIQEETNKKTLYLGCVM